MKLPIDGLQLLHFFIKVDFKIPAILSYLKGREPEEVCPVISQSCFL